MSNKLTVTKIVVTPRGGKDVALTIDEARDLYNQLAELFAPRLAPQVPIVIEREVLPRTWEPYRPYWVSNPTAADYPKGLPWVACTAPSGMHTRFMGDPVDA